MTSHYITVTVLKDTVVDQNHYLKKNDKFNIPQHLVQIDVESYNKILEIAPKCVSRMEKNTIIVNHSLRENISGVVTLKVTSKNIMVHVAKVFEIPCNGAIVSINQNIFDKLYAEFKAHGEANTPEFCICKYEHDNSFVKFIIKNTITECVMLVKIADINKFTSL